MLNEERQVVELFAVKSRRKEKESFVVVVSSSSDEICKQSSHRCGLKFKYFVSSLLVGSWRLAIN